MSVREIGPRKWLVRLQWTDRRTGKKRSAEATVDGSRKAALAKERELREAADRGDAPQRIKLRAYASSWLASRAASLSPTTASKYATSLDLHVLRLLGDLYVDAITPDDVRAYVAARLKEPASPTGRKSKLHGPPPPGAAAKPVKLTAGNTVLNELRVIRTISRDSVAEGLALRYWADRVKPPPVREYTDEDPNLLDHVGLAKLFAAVPAKWRAVVAFIAFTGMRWGEATACRWEDIDWTAGEFRIRRTNWKGTIVERKRKSTKKGGKVPIPWPLEARASLPSRGYIFTNERGELHKGTPLRKILDAACKKAGIARITTHGLRRTYNDIGRRVAEKEIVMSIVGHTTEAMHEHYSLVDANERRAVTTKVMELVGETSAPLPSVVRRVSRRDFGETPEGDEGSEGPIP